MDILTTSHTPNLAFDDYDANLRGTQNVFKIELNQYKQFLLEVKALFLIRE
jgi:hypothetical protein